MRRSSTAMRAALAGGSVDHEESLDLWYDNRPLFSGVEIESGSLRFDENATASIQQSGSCRVIISDAFGRSFSPREIGDAFSPFGARILLYSRVFTSSFSERVLMGVYEVTNVPSAVDEDLIWQGQRVTLNSRIELEFKELTNGIEADRFDVPYAPSDLSSTWAEYARIAQIPVVRSVADAPISRSVAYEESRIDAIYDLAANLGALPHMTQDGALSMRPKVWPSYVDTLTRGDGGTIVAMDGELSPDSVYNRVAVRARTDDRQAILGVAQVNSGPLRVVNPDGSRSPFGRRTRFVSSEFVTNGGQADAWASSELATSARLASVVANVEEFYNPLRERGDVIRLQRKSQLLTGRILSIGRTSGPTQQMKVELASG